MIDTRAVVDDDELFKDLTLEETEAKLTEGDSIYTGGQLLTFEQDQEGGELLDSGNFVIEDIPDFPDVRLNILQRLAAVEAALGIDPNAP